MTAKVSFRLSAQPASNLTLRVGATLAAALDVPAVNLAKQWIKTYADDPWGV